MVPGKITAQNQEPRTKNQMSLMSSMASLIQARLDEVKVELFHVFQDHLDAMLVEISEAHGIDLEELQAKYLVVSETPGPAPARKKSEGKKRAKSDSDSEERPKCEAKTAKGAACKNLALAGGVLCACHSKGKSDGKKVSKVDKLRKQKQVKPVSAPSSDDEAESPVRTRKGVALPKVATPPPAAKKGKKVAVHTHALDADEHSECGVCQTLGNAAAAETEEATGECSVSVEMQAVLDELFEDEEWSGTEDEGDDYESEGEEMDK